MQENNSPMGDRERLDDAVASQKYFSQEYNALAGISINGNLKSELLSILKEEQQILSELYNLAQHNNWYQMQQADPQRILEIKNQFTGIF